MRLYGYALVLLQDRRNRAAMLKSGAYRIMCVGESTTASGGLDSWPSQLEAVLNSSAKGIRFSVVNKGEVGVNTAYIASHLEENLKRYRPDMVITMMGINDEYIKYYEDIPDVNSVLFARSRAYRLLRIIAMHLRHKIKTADTLAAVSTVASPPSIPTATQQDLLAKEQELRQALDASPQNDSLYLELGRCYLQQGKFSQAEEMFKKAIPLEKNPDNAYLHLGRGYSMQGSYAPAQDALKTALKINPRNNQAYVELGILYGNQGLYAEAEGAFKQALQLKAAPGRIYLELGRCYTHWLRYAQAEEVLKKAIAFSPETAERPYLVLGWCYAQQKKYAQAEECLVQALKISPQDHRTRLDLAFCFSAEGKDRQAEEAFRQAVALNPRNARAYLGLGRCYAKQLEYALAEEAIQQALYLNPRDDRAYVELGTVYGSQGKYALSEEAFKKAATLDPGNDLAYTESGWYYLEQKKYPQAEEALKKAVSINRNNERAFLYLGDVYLRQNRLGEARAVFLRVIELNPESDKGYAGLAVLSGQTGERARVADLFAKADKSRSGYVSPVAQNNYLRCKEILDRRGVKLVCAQYPMRSVEPLQKIFSGRDGVILVDNEKVFKEALKAAPYSYYFSDMFGGEFGHCTKYGNLLLAKNIANTVFKEHLSRSGKDAS